MTQTEPTITGKRSKVAIFDHKKWRTVLIKTETQLKSKYPGISLIGPFGFELLYCAERAPVNIKRLYVYANLPANLHKEVIALEIQNQICIQIQIYYPEIYNDIVLFIRNDSFYKLRNEFYTCQPQDKLLDIQVRETTDPILTDYTDYLILVHQSILKNSGEVKNYQSSLRRRSRLFQLFLIQEALYEKFLPPLECGWNVLIHQIEKFVTNNIQMFFSTHNINCDKITPEEENCINQYVLPRSVLISNFLSFSESCDIIKHERVAYHAGEKSILSATFSTKVYETLLNKSIKAYENFV